MFFSSFFLPIHGGTAGNNFRREYQKIRAGFFCYGGFKRVPLKAWGPKKVPPYVVLEHKDRIFCLRQTASDANEFYLFQI
jgi:hypothetical protein